MRASKKTAQARSGAHAYSRLPFVSPVRGHVGIPRQCRQWGKRAPLFCRSGSPFNQRRAFHYALSDRRGRYHDRLGPLRPRRHPPAYRIWLVVLFFISLSTEGTRGSQRSCLGGPSHSPGLEGQNSVCASSWVFLRARRVMSVQSRHWLDYDPVALVVLLVGMSAVALLALSI